MEKELKMVKEQKEREEEKKLWNAINEQYKKSRERKLLQEQVNKIKREKQARKERRLNIATIIVMVLMMTTIVAMFIACFKNYNNVANKCDTEKGYVCSTYEIRQYSMKDGE